MIFFDFFHVTLQNSPKCAPIRDNLCYIVLHQLKTVAATQYFHIFSIKFNILSNFYISTLYHHISSLETNILSNSKPFPKYSDIFQFSSYCRTLHLYNRVLKNQIIQQIIQYAQIPECLSYHYLPLSSHPE